ncbi:hypothetical protein ACFFS4_24930 [Kutzneria kofuensis]|uniref:Uncharacterized protein n=1 Tax=Kutzneria kofuensis TaxID=103725 RepID=A0A7W9KNZ2_9PSEU|nr:hypothetical protein [Kutzneria kofuensis]MBB5896051.1 hypothetical protein [Kutzneria kofuensis]
MADPTPVGGRLIIPYKAGDDGTRPIASDVAVWDGPNVRVVPIERLEQYRDPTAAIWNDPTDGNRVEVGKFYQLVVRATNRGDLLYPPPGADNTPTDLKQINLEGWVLGFNAGAGALTDRLAVFAGFESGPIKPHQDFVLVSNNNPWQPTAKEVSDYNGHVCAQANIYAQETFAGDGADGTPPDGQQSGFTVFPYRDSHHAQRNLQIVAATVNTTVARNLLLAVPATDRCPLEANVAFREVELPDDPAELRKLVGDFGDLELRTPCGDPVDKVTVDAGDGCPTDDLDIELKPGDRKLLKITIPQYHEQRVGDVFGFDVVTTYHDGAKVYGGARFYVVVTPGLGV